MATYKGVSFTTVTAYTDPTLTDLAIIYSDVGQTEVARNPFPCYGNYEFYGTAGHYIVHGDFTRLLAVNSSTKLWIYKARTTATSGYPDNGHLLWDNATQTSATHLILSHLTEDGLDIDIFVTFTQAGDKIILQDSDDSGNNQQWDVTGAPVNTNGGTPTSYWTIPVTLDSSAGDGTTGFANNHILVLGVLS